METMKALYAIKRYIEDGPGEGAEPAAGAGPADRRQGQRRQRQPRPRRLAHAGRVPVRARSRQADQRAGRAGGDEVEAPGAEAVRLQARRGHQHRHARRAQGLLPRPRPQLLRRPVGLGEGHHREGPQPRLPEGHGPEDLEGHLRRRQARPGDVPASSRTDKYPDFPEELEFLHAEEILEMYPDLPRKQRETAIIQEHPAVFIIGIGWVLEGRLPARDARRRLRRLGHRDGREGRRARCTA